MDISYVGPNPTAWWSVGAGADAGATEALRRLRDDQAALILEHRAASAFKVFSFTALLR